MFIEFYQVTANIPSDMNNVNRRMLELRSLGARNLKPEVVRDGYSLYVLLRYSLPEDAEEILEVPEKKRQ